MVKRVILVSTIIMTIFSLSYFGNNIYVLSKSIEDKNNNYIDEDMKISLSKRDLLEKELTVRELKEDNNITDNLTEEEISSILRKDGYLLTEECSSTIYYQRNIVPNKYYIYKYDDSLAIYKSDSDLELIIEDKKNDIYDDGISFSDLREGDKTKILNYEMEFDTKSQAEEAISELIS